jgi:Flp pilus assembly protein protease CpaA
MFELVLISIALIGTGFAGYWDLKTTNVPDLLIIGMIIVAIILHATQGFMIGDFTNLINAFRYGGLFLLFGLIMYFTGQWGGGDGETLVAIGFLIPTATFVKTLLPFSLSYFVNMLLVGIVYSLIYVAYFVIKNPQYAGSIRKGFYKKIPVSKLKIDDMIGEDIPKLKIYKKFIRGLTKKEVQKIKKMKKYVIIREGIRFTPVFFISLIITLLFGDILLSFYIL